MAFIIILFAWYLRCCNEDGMILKPSIPATSIDRQLIMVNNENLVQENRLQ